MSYSCITFEMSEGVAKVTLNRPDVMNAFNLQMHAELAEVLDALAKDTSVRVLVLTGAGKAFCTGQDLEERRVPEGQPMPDLGESLRQRYNPVIDQISRFSFPVISAVNGPAVGAGAGLALAGDIVVASEMASFMVPFNKLGLVPDSGATWSLPRAIGSARAKAAVLLSEKITARQAYDWGMIWACVGADDLTATVDGYVKTLLSQPAMGMALTKQAFAQSSTNTLSDQLDLEATLQHKAGANPEYRARVMAFLNRKK